VELLEVGYRVVVVVIGAWVLVARLEVGGDRA
jgi:hypothetical protein